MTRWRAVAFALCLVGATACQTFSMPKPPPTVTLPKAELMQMVIRIDQVFVQMVGVVQSDCAALRKQRTAVYPMVAADCAKLDEIKQTWTSAVNDILVRIASASEGQMVDVEKLSEFLIKLAALAAKIAVLV